MRIIPNQRKPPINKSTQMRKMTKKIIIKMISTQKMMKMMTMRKAKILRLTDVKKSKKISVTKGHRSKPLKRIRNSHCRTRPSLNAKPRKFWKMPQET